MSPRRPLRYLLGKTLGVDDSSSNYFRVQSCDFAIETTVPGLDYRSFSPHGVMCSPFENGKLLKLLFQLDPRLLNK